MEGLLKYNYATADATGVAHDNIDEILADNKAKTAFDIGSIGPTPFMETDEGQQTLMDIAMESAFPGAAIGRVSKAAATGGRQLLEKGASSLKQRISNAYADIVDPKEIMKNPRPGKWVTKWGKKIRNPQAYRKALESSNSSVKEYIRKLQREYQQKFDPEAFTSSRHTANTKLSSNRLAMEKALDKHKIPHQRVNPAKPEEPLPLMDSVSELLHALRFRKN